MGTMFIAHLPAGYIAGSALAGIAKRHQLTDPGRLMLTVLVASILPDLDLLWFYFVDHRQHVHHTYWTHVPAFWLTLAVCVSLISVAVRRSSALPYIAAATLGVLVHLVLDTVAGGIYWLYPFSPAEFRWVHVPSVHGWWVANFLLHWSFALELLVLVAALATRRFAVMRGTGTA